MVQKDDVDSGAVAIVGLFGAIVTFVVIVAVQVLYYRMEKADEAKKYIAPGSAELKGMLTEQRNSLSEYKWVDRQKELVTIPIERAMDLVVREMQTKGP